MPLIEEQLVGDLRGTIFGHFSFLFQYSSTNVDSLGEIATEDN